MANTQLGDLEKVTYLVTAPLDADNNPEVLDPGDVVTAVSSDPDSATVVPDATPTAGSLASGFIVGGKKLGTVNITVSAKKADGTLDASTVIPIDIVAGKATTLNVSLGTPVAQ